MEMPPSVMDLPMESAYTSHMITAKMGRASQRLVMILSILSEVESSPLPFFL